VNDYIDFFCGVARESQYYRERLNLKGKCATLQDYPVMDKALLRKKFRAILADNAHQNVIEFTDGLFSVKRSPGGLKDVLIAEVTSGSSGTPLKIVKTNAERMTLGLKAWQQRQRISRRVNQKNTFFTAHVHISQPKIVEDLQNHHPENLRKILSYLTNDMRPLCIHGTPGDLYQYGKYLLDSGDNHTEWRPDFIETVGEYLSDEQRTLIETAFRTKIVDNYGALEVWNIAYECPFGRMHISDGVVLEQYDPIARTVLPPQFDGEAEILVTSTILRALPIIRYRIGDIGVIDRKTCACGNEHPSVRLLPARVANLLDTYRTEGAIFDGIGFFKWVVWESVRATNSDIQRYRVIQEAGDSFFVYLVLPEHQFVPFCAAFEGFVKQGLGYDKMTRFFGVTEDHPIFRGKNMSFLNRTPEMEYDVD
jgi:phenylacetate-CoA ligase